MGQEAEGQGELLSWHAVMKGNAQATVLIDCAGPICYPLTSDNCGNKGDFLGSPFTWTKHFSVPSQEAGIMRKFIPLAFVVCLALVGLAVVGCTWSSSSKTSPGGEETLVIETEEIILEPGSEKVVKVKQGKAASAEAAKDSGVSAKVDGDKVTVSADKDAKEGPASVTVKSAAGKTATLKVNVKKKAEVPAPQK
jgi:hypothetical protein